MRSRSLVVVLTAVVAGCGPSEITFPKPECGSPPRLEGRWTGTLGQEELQLNLKEACKWEDLFMTPGWIVEGGWAWGALSGSAASRPYYFRDRVGITLDAPDQTGVSVRLEFAGNPPVGNVLVGFARGSWRNPADTSKTLVAFDTVALTIRRTGTP